MSEGEVLPSSSLGLHDKSMSGRSAVCVAAVKSALRRAGVEEALKMLGFRSGRSRSARPGRTSHTAWLRRYHDAAMLFPHVFAALMCTHKSVLARPNVQPHNISHLGERVHARLNRLLLQVTQPLDEPSALCFTCSAPRRSFGAHTASVLNTLAGVART